MQGEAGMFINKGCSRTISINRHLINSMVLSNNLYKCIKLWDSYLTRKWSQSCFSGLVPSGDADSIRYTGMNCRVAYNVVREYPIIWLCSKYKTWHWQATLKSRSADTFKYLVVIYAYSKLHSVSCVIGQLQTECMLPCFPWLMGR